MEINNTFYAGHGFSIFSQGFGKIGIQKSTQEKIERQQKSQSQIDFFEHQIENLKNMKSDSLEDIERKLEMFHNYENQIATVKKQYNNEQMLHVMDEAIEQGEKIAEHSEENLPKTEKDGDRRNSLLEKMSGIEDDSSLDGKSKEDMTLDEYKQWYRNQVSKMPVSAFDNDESWWQERHEKFEELLEKLRAQNN